MKAILSLDFCSNPNYSDSHVHNARCLIIDEPASDECENTSNTYDIMIIIIINIQECDNSDKSYAYYAVFAMPCT